MEASDVIDFYNLLVNNGISVWIDGGWGVDALLSKRFGIYLPVEYKNKF